MRASTAKKVLRVGVLLLFGNSFLWRCANIVSPQGGPKDSLPPVVVSVAPAFYTKNFSGQKIFIGFDEYVQIKDQQKEFFSSPMMKRNPTITTRGKGIQITIMDTLAPNQTYALNFGNSIVDNNESNVLSGLRYVFSTGPEIDSLFLSGYTVSASKGDSVSGSLIFFYPAEVDSVPAYDSTLLKLKPAAVARAASNGIFIAQNLKPIDYRIYAIKDNNGNFTYDPETDMVGFLEGSHNPVSEPDFRAWFDTTRHYLTAEPQLYFKMFTDSRFRRQNLTESKRPGQHKVTLYFGAPNPDIREFSLDSIAPENIITEYVTKGRDTINYWLNVPSAELPDTIKGRIVYMKHDSVNRLVPDTARLALYWKYIESKEEKKAREAEEKKREKALKDSVEYKPPVKPNPFRADITKGELNPEKGITLTFDMPLTQVDTSAFSLIRSAEDDKMFKVKFTLSRDTADMMKWHLQAPWAAEQKYSLTIPAGALHNVAGQTNDTLRNDYTVLSPEKFGTLVITVKGKTPESRYVLYLRDENGRTLNELRNVSSGTYRFNYISPGNVRLGILEDINGNGVWDTGNLIGRRQPERTEPYVGDTGDELLAVKSNWEIEITADMDKIFAPVTFETVNERLRKAEAVRLKKLAEEREKRRKEAEKQKQQSEGSGGLGGFGSGMKGMKTTVGTLSN